MMTAGLDFNLLEQDLLLLPEKAIYWKQQKALIAADVHLGKVGHFRKAGIAVPQQLAKDDDGLEILDIGVRPLGRGPVIEHEQRSGQREYEEEEERQPTHAPRVRDRKRVTAHLHRMQVEEDVGEDRERLVLARVRVAVAEQ